MVIALTVFFFVSHLPNHLTNIIAMATERYTLPPKTAFILELVERSDILYPPFAYLFLNKRYRIALKGLITDTAARTRRVENHAFNRNGNNRNFYRATERLPNGQRRQQRRQVMFANKVEPSPGPSGTNPAAHCRSNLNSESTLSTCGGFDKQREGEPDAKHKRWLTTKPVYTE